MATQQTQTNPFLSAYTTPHETVPFHQIKIEDYEPAIMEGIKEQVAEIDLITDNNESPTFSNTILALENSGKLLDRVTTVLFNLMSAETCDELDAIAEKVTPALTDHSNNISLNEKLFARIKAVFDHQDELELDAESLMLLNKTYDSFVRKGANLTGEDKQKFRSISKELSLLSLKFSQNLLKETNRFEMILDINQLAGLPESTIQGYAQNAKEKGKEGYLVTLQAPDYIPFMKYAKDRSLRKALYMGYQTQCTHDDEYNNMEIVRKLVNLRMQLAQLLGYESYADYILKKRMAEKKEEVYALLDQLLEAYTNTAHKEVNEVTSLAKKMEG